MSVMVSGTDSVRILSPIQCATCGVERDDTRGDCPICADERQYLPADGVQRWTSPDQQAADGARIELVEREPNLWGLVQHDCAGIGQQAKLAVTPSGNVLVDVPAHIDASVVAAVTALGGVDVIVPTHPHMFGVQSAWSAAFDAPVLVSAADADWVGRDFPHLRTWTGQLAPVPGVLASQPGGHFPGSSVICFTGADGEGVLLSGDTIAPTRDPRWVSFMRSYPINIPLSAAVVRRIADHVGRYEFARLYGNFAGPGVPADARAVVRRSAERYAEWVSGVHDDLT